MQKILDLPTLLSIAGLILTLGGAVWAARAVIIDDKTAGQLAATKWDKNEELKAALLDQSRAARIGLILVALGSGIQIIGVVLQAVGAAKG